SGFSYGREWDRASILAGSVAEADFEGHGTHVAGIAAGSGRGTGNARPAYRYVGIAPEADLIVVQTDFTFSHIVDAVSYGFSRAAAMGKPAVVNLSLGSNYGPHDGTDPQDQQLNALTGPGRIICASAGNSGADTIHAETTVAQGDSAILTFYLLSSMP